MLWSSSRRPGRWGAVLVLLAALGLSGCGSTATVSGKVFYKGAPLKGGNVTFVSTEGKSSLSTQINEDGSYTIPNVPVGTVTICVETESLNPAGKMRTPKYRPPPGQQAPEGLDAGNTTDTAKRYMRIPPEYADPAKSGLTHTVSGPTQTRDIELK